MVEYENEKVVISKSAIQTIVRLAIEEVKSVANFSKSINRNEKLYNLKISDNVVSVNVFAAFYYGYNLKEEIEKLQDNIKNSIETMLGMEVDRVNVYVYDLIINQEH